MYNVERNFKARAEQKEYSVFRPPQPDLHDIRLSCANKIIELKKQLPNGMASLHMMNPKSLRKLRKECANPYIKKQIDLRIDLLAELKSNEITLQMIDEVFLDDFVVHESSMTALGDDGEATTMKSAENFTDMAGAEYKVESVGNSNSSQQGSITLTKMNNYLSRPVEIYKATIAIGAEASIQLDVWNLFTLVPTVRAKMRNFPYFRGDLSVRISVAGTPFHWGRLLVSYQPYPQINIALLELENAVINDTGARPLLLNYLSQANGSSIIDVAENKPLELTIPYISTKPMHRLYVPGQTTAISDVTPFTDLRYAGDIYIYNIDPMKALTGTTNPIYIQVYAWMDDVELGTNTGTQIQVTTESDERKTGPIESYATKLQRLFSSISNVAIIGPYANASAMIMGGISGIASIYGWSKPVLDQKTSLVKNEPLTNNAQVIGTDTALRIVLDPKQELTVDPRCVGIDFDDMSIQHIASRATYVQSVLWNVSDGAMASIIWSMRVHPNIVTVLGQSTKWFCQPTAMAYAVSPFAFWRGTLRITVDIQCSAFHRGKLAIFYEPNLSQFNLIRANIVLNKQYMLIIDLQETHTLTFDVAWASHRSWLRNCTAGNAPMNIYEPGRATDPDGFANGWLGMIPLTQITSPDGSAATMNFYMSCPDLQVNFLTSQNMLTERIQVINESDTYHGTSLMSKPVTAVTLNKSAAVTTNIASEHFGEQPLSFRSLLKRKVTVDAFHLFSATATVKYAHAVYNIYPDNHMPFAATSITYYDLFSYLRLAYTAVRGGMRYTARVSNEFSGISPIGHVKVSLLPVNTAVVKSITIDAVVPLAKLEGTVAFVPWTNGGVDFELPLYTNNLFVFAGQNTFDEAGTATMENYWVRQFSIDFSLGAPAITTGTYLMLDMSTAEDFSFMRYQGAPYYSCAPLA